MAENLLTTLLEVAAIYVACGLVQAVLFLAFWLRSFDPSAAHGTWGFRLLIFPGLILLWPVILAVGLVVRTGETAEAPIRPESLRHYHAIAFLVLSILIPLFFALALSHRAPRVEDTPATAAADRINHH